jgi:hypothetical protein
VAGQAATPLVVQDDAEEATEDGFSGMLLSSLFMWPFENDAVYRCLYIRSRHRLVQGSGYVIP